MKKAAYIICICALSVMVFHEVKHNVIYGDSPMEGSSAGDDAAGVNYVPAAHIISQVRAENTEETGEDTGDGRVSEVQEGKGRVKGTEDQVQEPGGQVEETREQVRESEERVKEAGDQVQEPGGQVKAAGEQGQENEKKEIKQAVQKIAYLTFDDGPSENTRKILMTLKDKNAVATFFLIGKEITEGRKDIVRETVEQGNAVGVHTYCHEKNKLYGNATCFLEDYEQASKSIQDVTGSRPTLHRFPWGSNNRYVSSYVDALHEKLHGMGVKSFDWNVSGEDAIGGTVAQNTIFNNIKKDLTRYDQPIILLHDSATMDNTAAVLGQIIDYIRSEGYEFATLDSREEYMFPENWR